MAKTDWNFILESYNSIKGADYQNDRDLLADLYRKLGSIEKIGTILGLHCRTISSRMDVHGCRRKRKPHHGAKRAAFLEIPTSDIQGMTASQLAKRLGVCDQYAYTLIGRMSP